MNRPILGPLSRFFCFFSNILVAYFLRFYLLPKFGFTTQLEEISLELFLMSPMLSEIGQSEVFRFFFDLTLFYILFSFISHLLFSVGLTQFLITATTEGSFVSKRLKSVLRFFFSFITTPFLLFDLPLLFKKKSFKETITKSRIFYRGGLLKNVFLTFLFPAILVGSAVTPLFLGPKFLQNGIPTQVLPDGKERPAEDDFVINIESPYMKMYGQVNINRNLFILPHIPNKNTEGMGVSVFDFQKKRMVKLTNEGALNIFDITNEYRFANPLFPVFYPQLSLLNINDTAEVPQLNTELTLKYISVLQDILPLNLENILNTIFKRGPLLLSFYRARERFTQALGIEYQSSIQIKSKGERIVLISSIVENAGPKRVILSPVGPTESPIYHINYKSNSGALAQILMSDVIFGSNWRAPGVYIDQPTNHPAFHALEVLTQKEVILPLPPSLAGLFENAINQAKDSGDRVLLNEVYRSLNNLISLIENRKNQEDQQVLPLFQALKEK